MQNPPESIKAVLNTLKDGGHSAYLVGGCVRDLVMGRLPHDWDVATSAIPEDVMGLFPKTIPTGIQHGTVTVVTDDSHVEVTTFRQDGAYLDHRRPEQVHYVTDLREDLARRDFTINAMAMDMDGEIHDPFGGQWDIMGKTIRCVGDPRVRFEEDALRMFRALRFSAQLGFEIEHQTLAAMREKASLAANLSSERVRDEIAKILLSPRPELLVPMRRFGLLAAYTSDVSPHITQPPVQIDETLPILSHWAVFAAILLRSNIIASPKVFLQALRLDSHTIQVASTAALLGFDLPITSVALKHLLAEHGMEIITVATQIAAAYRNPAPAKVLQEILQSGDCYSLMQLNIQGTDLLALGIPPGRQVGEILQALLDHVIAYPADNERDALLARVQAHGLDAMGEG